MNTIGIAGAGVAHGGRIHLIVMTLTSGPTPVQWIVTLSAAWSTLSRVCG